MGMVVLVMEKEMFFLVGLENKGNLEELLSFDIRKVCRVGWLRLLVLVMGFNFVWLFKWDMV